MRHLIVLATTLFLAAGTLAQAKDVTVESRISVSGFNNASVGSAIKSTDITDSWHSCTIGTDNECPAKNTYGSPPKNMHIYICIPATLEYSYTSACQSLLNRNDDGDCHKNSTQIYGCGGNTSIGPKCQWRTTSSGTAEWTWKVTAQQGLPYQIDCSNSGFSGTH